MVAAGAVRLRGQSRWFEQVVAVVVGAGLMFELSELSRWLEQQAVDGVVDRSAAPSELSPWHKQQAFDGVVDRAAAPSGLSRWHEQQVADGEVADRAAELEL